MNPFHLYKFICTCYLYFSFSRLTLNRFASMPLRWHATYESFTVYILSRHSVTCLQYFNVRDIGSWTLPSLIILSSIFARLSPFLALPSLQDCLLLKWKLSVFFVGSDHWIQVPQHLYYCKIHEAFCNTGMKMRRPGKRWKSEQCHIFYRVQVLFGWRLE